jgi:hypothetical protein
MVGEGHALAVRVNLLEAEAVPPLVTVTVTERTVPAGKQEGEVQTTLLVVAVFEAVPSVPTLASHEKPSLGVSSSWAVTEKVTAL